MYLNAFVRVTFAMMKHQEQKQVEEERVYLTCTSLLKEVRTRTQACKKLEAEADKEAMDGYCVLVCSSKLVQTAFFYRTQDDQFRNITTHNGLGPFPIITT